MRTTHFFYLVFLYSQGDLGQIMDLPSLHQESLPLLDILSTLLTAFWSMDDDFIYLLAQCSRFACMSILPSTLAATWFSSTVGFASESIT